MSDNQNIKPRPIHRAALIKNNGHVSALCFDKPRAINLKIASWTLRDNAVTCEKCLKKMSAKVL